MMPSPERFNSLRATACGFAASRRAYPTLSSAGRSKAYSLTSSLHLPLCLTTRLPRLVQGYPKAPASKADTQEFDKVPLLEPSAWQQLLALQLWSTWDVRSRP